MLICLTEKISDRTKKKQKKNKKKTKNEFMQHSREVGVEPPWYSQK